LLVCAVIAGAETRPAAPDFQSRDAKGKTLRLTKYRGKVVLLDFWATWCGGCKVEIPWFSEFAARYKRDGLAVIGVAMDDDGWKSVKPFLRERKVKYPVVVGDEGIARTYGVDQMPMTLLIDRDGKIAFTHTGLVDKEEFEREMRSLLHR
jgi:peroxiredoxin